MSVSVFVFLCVPAPQPQLHLHLHLAQGSRATQLCNRAPQRPTPGLSIAAEQRLPKAHTYCIQAAGGREPRDIDTRPESEFEHFGVRTFYGFLCNSARSDHSATQPATDLDHHRYYMILDTEGTLMRADFIVSRSLSTILHAQLPRRYQGAGAPSTSSLAHDHHTRTLWSSGPVIVIAVGPLGS